MCAEYANIAKPKNRRKKKTSSELSGRYWKPASSPAASKVTLKLGATPVAAKHPAVQETSARVRVPHVGMAQS